MMHVMPASAVPEDFDGVMAYKGSNYMVREVRRAPGDDAMSFRLSMGRTDYGFFVNMRRDDPVAIWSPEFEEGVKKVEGDNRLPTGPTDEETLRRLLEQAPLTSLTRADNATLGDIAKVFQEWKKQGITLGAVKYAAERVWWEDAERRIW